MVLAPAIRREMLLFDGAPRQLDGAFALAAGGFGFGTVARRGLGPFVDLLSIAAFAARSAAPSRSSLVCSVATIVAVRRMFLAWKKFHRFDASIWEFSAAVCALLPSVSENARNSASTAISNATRLLMVWLPSWPPPACLLVVFDLVLDLVLYRVHTVAHVAPPSVDDRFNGGPLHSLPGAAYHGSRSMIISENRSPLFGITPSDGRCDRLQADGRCQQPYRSASSTAKRGRAIPGWRADRRRAPADAWRKNDERMRRRRVRQAKRAAQPFHDKLDDARRQRAAARADEQRAVGRQVVGA